ncbi:MAG: hypothetical protein K0S74_1446 [Chlamydiales bacterium]|jgi:hypothetical protein|nr:hypothetical protein [Chlamydiales bacterium]
MDNPNSFNVNNSNYDPKQLISIPDDESTKNNVLINLSINLPASQQATVGKIQRIVSTSHIETINQSKSELENKKTYNTEQVKQRRSLQQRSNNMKLKEVRSKYETMKGIFTKEGRIQSVITDTEKQLNILFSAETDLTNQQTAQNKIVQEKVLRTLIHKFPNECNNQKFMKAFKEGGFDQAIETVSELKTKSDLRAHVHFAIPDFTKKLEALKQEKELAKNEIRGIIQDIAQLFSIKDPKNITEYNAVNQALIELLRNGLRSKAYEILKEQSDEPLIQLLHELCSGIYNQVKAIDAYAELGKDVLEQTKRELEKSKETRPLISMGSIGLDIHSTIQNSHNTTKKHLLTDHHITGKAKYTFSGHIRQTLGSLASEGGIRRAIASLFGHGTYDSHKNLANNPSLRSTRTIALGTGDDKLSLRLNNVYTGSPTIGDDIIAPEFEATLIAAENSQLDDMLGRNETAPKLPHMISYTNLQNWNKSGGEGPRSRTIMALAEKYPTSFCGVTLSKDSSFYKKGVLSTNILPWYKKLPVIGKKEIKPKPEDFISNIEALFIKKSSNADKLSINREPCKKEGFVLPSNISDPDLVKIINASLKQTHNICSIIRKEHPIPTNSELWGAHIETFYSILQEGITLHLAKQLTEQGIKQATIQANASCKEDIDRGGMENAKQEFLSLVNTLNKPNLNASEKETAIVDFKQKIVGIIESRALSARNRVILEHRMTHILSLIKLVEWEKFDFDQMLQELLQEIWEKPGMTIDSSEHKLA